MDLSGSVQCVSVYFAMYHYHRDNCQGSSETVSHSRKQEYCWINKQLRAGKAGRRAQVCGLGIVSALTSGWQPISTDINFWSS